MNKPALETYGKASKANLSEASTLQVVRALLDGALTHVLRAKGAIEHNDVESRHMNLMKARDIMMGLSSGLDYEQGGELAPQLAALYDYISRRLTDANVSNDLKALEEARGLLAELKAGWDALPDVTASTAGGQVK